MTGQRPPVKRRLDISHLFKWDGAELVDGTVLTESVFWDSRMGGVFLLDGSQQFYPAAQVKRCWHTTDTKAEPPKADPRLVSYVNKPRHTKADT